MEYKTRGSIEGSNGVLSCSGVVRCCCCCVKVRRSDGGWWCFGLACCCALVLRGFKRRSLGLGPSSKATPLYHDSTRIRLKSRGIEIDTWFVAWRLVSVSMPLSFPCQINTGTFLSYFNLTYTARVCHSRGYIYLAKYESKHHGDDPLTAPSPHVPECLSLCTPRVCEPGQSVKIPPHLHGPPSTIHIHARPGIDAEPSALSLYTKTAHVSTCSEQTPLLRKTCSGTLEENPTRHIAE